MNARTARTYSIHKLSTATDLDMVTGFKKLSSKEAYFDALHTFFETAPEMVKTLNENGLRVGTRQQVDTLDKLQNMVLDISSPSLVWKMARLATAASQGNKSAILENLRGVRKDVDVLCSRIREAESAADENAALAARDQPPAAAEEPKSEPLQVVPVNPEIFEKTFMLIENLEFEPAMIDLQALLSFSYHEEVDEELYSILKNLHEKQYLAARNAVWTLRQKIKKISDTVGKKNKKQQILAIDDFPDTLRVLKTGLKGRFDVVGVTNHMTALKYLSTNTADLILLDIEMPDMDGYTLLGIIRKLEEYKFTPVIFLTANASPENVKTAFEQGGNDFIRKPIDLNLLTERISKHLQDDRARKPRLAS